jgi:hypothetical protein
VVLLPSLDVLSGCCFLVGGNFFGTSEVFPDAKRIENCGIRKRHDNNNRVERLNGTLRERAKVQRGLKTVKTLITEGQRIHYNFIKPHMALEGKTPGEVAGLGIKGWKQLLESALSTKTENKF